MKKRASCIDPAVCPSPAALMTWVTEKGRVQVLETAWLGVICSRPAMLSLAVKSSSRPCSEIESGAPFVVNLPAADQLHTISCSRLGDAGLTLQSGDGGVPLIAECPVRIECRKASCSTHFGQSLIQGEIIAVHVGHRIYRAQDMNLGWLNPLTGNPDLIPSTSWTPWGVLSQGGTPAAIENFF